MKNKIKKSENSDIEAQKGADAFDYTKFLLSKKLEKLRNVFHFFIKIDFERIQRKKKGRIQCTRNDDNF